MMGKVIDAMIGYYAGDILRINHFLKVYALAKSIGECEGLSENVQEILEIAAATHDIGIKPSEEKYGDASGPHQEQEGPPAARTLLGALGIEETVIERVCCLIGRHHTYTNIDGPDHQILIEADFLVNLHEGGCGASEIRSVREKLFRTATGIRYLDRMFLSRIDQ
ncbi:MAG TPA: HD domain-containing protein [Feifaniaceae bacterium]|nr:HD domain-containing protein [Feifaniaceae bacterium]